MSYDVIVIGTGPGANANVDRLIAETPEKRNEHSGMMRVDHRIKSGQLLDVSKRVIHRSHGHPLINGPI